LDRAPADAAAPRRLAICLDDAGLHAGVNEAALALAHQGRISATSAMVGAPRWREAAAALRGLDAATIDIGLHLDLTEHPLLPGVRRPLSQWLARTHLGLADRKAMRREIDAQLDAFEQTLGRPPAYVDGHQHVHQLPGVREPLLEALQARGYAAAPWLRDTRQAPGTGRKAWLIDFLGSGGLRRLARERGFRQNGHFLGVYDFTGDADRYLALLGGWLRAAADGDLMMCHAAPHAPANDAIGPARRWEYEVLAGEAFGRLLARERVQVVAMSRMLAAR
jgi:chitin disaccharide deacetylase